MPALRRARCMSRLRNLIEEHMDELAAILTNEHGKVLDDARGEVIRGLEVVEFACGAPQLLKGEFSDNKADLVAHKYLIENFDVELRLVLNQNFASQQRSKSAEGKEKDTKSTPPMIAAKIKIGNDTDKSQKKKALTL